MSKLPLVSVCMITYNHEAYIKQAIEGVLMQNTNFDFEFIIADDCSTDQTESIINKIIKKHPDANCIKYYKHTKNKGMMPNFVFALQKCQGKYIALCEGDDYWTDPLKLQKQVDFLEDNKEYVCCFHLCETLFEKNKHQLKKQPVNRIKYEYTVKNLLTYWNIPTASIVFRNEEKLKFPPWFTKIASGDIALIMLIFDKGKFKLFEEYMSVYRISGKGISTSHSNYRMIHYRAVLYSYLNEFFNYKYEKEIYDALHYIYLNYSDSDELKIKQNKQSRVIKLAKNFLIKFKSVFK